MKWVLVLESSEVDREYLAKIIDRLGYSLFRANSTEEALRFMNQSLPDAFIVGEGISDHDPIDLVRKIKEDRILSSQPLLLMTSNSDPQFHQGQGRPDTRRSYSGPCPYENSSLAWNCAFQTTAGCVSVLPCLFQCK